MKKLISRVCCLCCVVLVLAACLPLSAFAVDPVSAGVMANAFAQAIAAYGASNGVAMTFDVTSTDGIGETMHELWSDFRAGTQDADDYATLAAALFPDLYYKAASVVGGVSDVYTVGYNISSTYVEEFDNFFDWLLSGPAEMVKVDNAYYQFSQAQIGSNAQPIHLVTYGGLSGYTIGALDSSWNNDLRFANSTLVSQSFFQGVAYRDDKAGFFVNSNYPDNDVYAFLWQNTSSDYRLCYCCLDNQHTVYWGYRDTRNNLSDNRTSANFTTQSGLGFYYFSSAGVANGVNGYLPKFASLNDGLNTIKPFLVDGATGDSLGVKAATNTGVAEFPDTTDPNYEAVGKQIPSTVPWDNTAYGDGTGTLTDAQAGAIAAGADTAIARDGVLDLAGTDEVTDEPGVDDPPTTDPDDYAVPGLAEIFPFCIPFDIYNFLSALAANPVAPHFTATLDFPEAVGGTQTIDIDFDSPTWNQLAQLLRLLELLAFIIGLALLTRSMFIRG